MLDDGNYDVLVVGADPVEGAPDVTSLDLTIVSGEAKGEVVSVRASGLGEPLDLLGIPGTLTVVDGQPSVRLEP